MLVFYLSGPGAQASMINVFNFEITSTVTQYELVERNKETVLG